MAAQIPGSWLPVLLDGLADGAAYRRSTGGCGDCAARVTASARYDPCPGHAEDAAMAARYEELGRRIRSLLAGAGDVDPAAGQGVHEALLAQHPYGLVDGPAGDTELLDEHLPGRQRPAGRDLAAADLLPEDPGELLIDRDPKAVIDTHMVTLGDHKHPDLPQGIAESASGCLQVPRVGSDV